MTLVSELITAFDTAQKMFDALCCGVLRRVEAGKKLSPVDSWEIQLALAEFKRTVAFVHTELFLKAQNMALHRVTAIAVEIVVRKFGESNSNIDEFFEELRQSPTREKVAEQMKKIGLAPKDQEHIEKGLILMMRYETDIQQMEAGANSRYKRWKNRRRRKEEEKLKTTEEIKKDNEKKKQKVANMGGKSPRKQPPAKRVKTVVIKKKKDNETLTGELLTDAQIGQVSVSDMITDSQFPNVPDAVVEDANDDV